MNIYHENYDRLFDDTDNILAAMIVFGGRTYMTNCISYSHLSSAIPGIYDVIADKIRFARTSTPCIHLPNNARIYCSMCSSAYRSEI